MDAITIILSVLSTLSIGANIMQLLTFRAYKRKQNGEATSIEITNLKSVISALQEELKRQEDKIAKFEERLKNLEKVTCYRMGCKSRI